MEKCNPDVQSSMKPSDVKVLHLGYGKDLTDGEDQAQDLRIIGRK